MFCAYLYDILSQLAISDVAVSGTYGIEAPSRKLNGSGDIVASRDSASDPWKIQSLTVQFNAAAVAAANAERSKVARDAGYEKLADASSAIPCSPPPEDTVLIKVV